jgi:limonene-1,2-epoxide hydrolase
MAQMVPSTTADIKNLVVSGGIVMVERVDIFEMQGKSFDVEISGVFEVNGDGRITRWRDYYDMRSLEDRVAAALASSD